MHSKYGASYAMLEQQIVALNDQKEENSLTNIRDLNSQESDEASLWIKQAHDVIQTPKRLSIESVLEKNFESAASLQSIQSGNCKMLVAYSIKTCPDQNYLASALKSGLSAEAISMAEVETALKTGWQKDQIILNGPAKWWPLSMKHHDGLKAVFCDSGEEFERLLSSGRRDKTWGFRLKIPSFHTRFGADVDSYDDIRKIVAMIEAMPREIDLGFHIHLASNLIGNGHWEDAVKSAVNWAQTIALQAQRNVSILDLGGGYHPRDFHRFEWKKILAFAHREIPTLKNLVIEPGRAVSQNTAIMVTSVQDIRRKRGAIQDVVVDTCISELPLARAYPHRMYVLRGELVVPLSQGFSRLLGRICMEDDILADSIQFPPSISIGDRIVIADAGAYERSMSYEFGYGRIGPTM